MKLDQIRKMFEATQGRAFTVYFYKKDGTPRRMNARLGVKKHLRGGVSTIAHKDNLLGCYDMQIPEGKGYRCIPLDRIVKAKLDGVEVIFRKDVDIDKELEEHKQKETLKNQG